MLGGSGGMLSQKIFKFRCSEIASEAIFVLKFIFLFFVFGCDAARIPGPSVFGALLAMWHDSRSLVVPDSLTGGH